ncbi:Putative alpha/beta hydrolase-3 [Septoria linicola]|uniref:Alpha/beta hydrolase-3 n=1 Tax=Septoria linicola TaxID=215465 RepID=A0A9Q9EHX5_9PEZI|nr:putative alpha/beta hydrolase-3 [Septoria linicola]USW49743.1 Putative alpha/beta hydrolase-3 [Septoria linicola]
MVSASSPSDGQLNMEDIAAQYTRPGRLGDPNMKFFQEPRAHPKLVEVFSAFGMDGSQGSPFDSVSREELSSTSQMAKSQAQTEKLYEILPNDLPADDSEPQIRQETIPFTSFDGAERNMYVFRPTDQAGPLPAVLYLHGGGMVLLNTRNKVHDRWSKSLAVQGLVAISVDFRNAYDNGKQNLFPTGLNDCAAAVQYVHKHRADLNISKIIIQGESGGANLSLATALKAKREGWVDQIAGVYGVVPYISNGYGWSDSRKLKELPSLYECEGYWLYTAMMAGMGQYYSGGATEDPLAWPYYASIEDCKGLPPHILTMDELDPLRDEGMAYYRKLLAAGVEAHAQVNLGVVHATALVFRKLLPEIHNKAVRDIVSFAKSL